MGDYLSLSDMVELCVFVCVCADAQLCFSTATICIALKGRKIIISSSFFSGLRCTCLCGERCDSPARMRMFFSLCVWEELALTLQCWFSAAHPDFLHPSERCGEAFWNSLSFYSFGADESSRVVVDSGGQGILQGFKTTL